jgi:multidrug resistance efflux pump
MPEKDLTPIPIPARQQWREFRVLVLPIITFSMLVTMIGWLWVRYVAPSNMIGEVETKRAGIISTVAGVVRELKVDRLASVTNGQELAVIEVCDADQLHAQIAAVESGLRLMKARMDLDKARNVNSYIDLNRELEIEKLNLEVERIKSIQSEGELARAKSLYDNKLIALGSGSSRNDFGYDVALRDHNSILATIASKEKTVADLQAGLDRMKAAGATEVGLTNDVIEQDIAAQRREIEQLKKPVVLVSPINGFVSVIDHVPGERITAGEKLLVVSAEKSHRIVAWVRQPVTQRPEPGDIVSVRRATLGQPEFNGTVATVGKQLEEINPTAVPLTTAIQRAEFGLPLIVNVDEKIELIPGEAVQLRVIKHAAGN